MRLNPDGEVPDVGIPRRLAASMTIGEQQEWLHRHLGRHRVTRRTALRGGASVLAALGATTAPWALAGCARAASTPVGVIGRHLSFGSDPRRQMAIAAELTGKPVGPVVVDVGADAGYGQTVEAEVRNLVSMVPQQDGSIRARAVLRPRLRRRSCARRPAALTVPPRGRHDDARRGVHRRARPNRVGPVHVHRVRRPGRERDGRAEAQDNHYKPDDTRRTAAPSDALVALVAAQRPAFHLLAGDICYADPHASDAGVRAALAPIFDRFAVDLVVQGHNHQYERTDPICGGVATRAAADGASVEAARDGTTYICCGSGGRPRYTWQPGETDSYRGAPTPARPVTSYVAGPDGAKAPRPSRGRAPATSTTPSCPCTSRPLHRVAPRR